MFRGANESSYSSLGSLTGLELWRALQRSREDLEQAFVLLLAQAGSGSIPCTEVERYNGLVEAQVALEQRGLNELQQANIYSGVSSPAALPTVTACQSGEQSIWLRPEQAQTALAGAVQRYQGLREARQRAGARRGGGVLLGSESVSSLMVGGNVLVGWAAQAVAERTYTGIRYDEVQTHEAAASSCLEARKAQVPSAQAQAALSALEQGRGGARVPLGLSVWQALAVAFGAGLVLAGVAWYIWGRNPRAPALSGSCPRRQRRALVME